MPYIPLPVPAHAPEAVRSVCGVIDGAFQEIRSIMEVEATYGTPGKDQFQRSLATLLLSATDGASQIFIAASERDNGKRFTRFLRENFPWLRVQMDPDAACTYMWESARCSQIHRFGLYSGDEVRKFARPFTLDDIELAALENGREPSKPFIVQEDGKTVVWLDALYWSLRQAIANAIDTPEKTEAVHKHLKSRKWK